MTVLATAFGPFGSFASNPTGDAVEQLKTSDGLVTHVFAVSYRTVEVQLPSLLRRRQFVVAIAFGLVSSTDVVRVELLAHNESTSRAKDASGETRMGPILPDGPAELPTTLPIEVVEGVLDRLSVRYEESEDARGYVCNFLFYLLQSLAPDYGIRHSGFVHLPHPDRYLKAHGRRLDLVSVITELSVALARCDGTATG